MACICTIGYFDGVHLGHRHLINQLCQIAQEKGLPAHVVTFSRHPRMVCNSANVRLLTSLEERMTLLLQMGVEKCHILEFTQEISLLTAREFMKRYLKDMYHAEALLVGYNHHFGHPMQGEGFEQYRAYGREMGIDVIEATPFTGLTAKVSSSAIRRELEQSNIKEANRLLGRPYSLTATVVHGRSVGRTLGFPTANLQPIDDCRLVPPSGCYAVRIIMDAREYAGMLYIGKRPTFNEEETPAPTIEVNLFDFQDDLYGKTLTVEFYDLLREEKQFADMEQLRCQLAEDHRHTIEILKQSITK